MTTKSLRTLLAHLIDYAGLFPPAALTMQDAVRNYARYREGEQSWALGRFVVPESRVAEVPSEFPLTVLWDGDVPQDRAESLETKASSDADLERIAQNAAGKPVYVEIAGLALLDGLARHGLRAKIRTGGVTEDAFPSVANVAAFLRACRERNVPFKATAGLHHPLRCVKPLTYEPDAPSGTMHGFLNVFLAAALPEQAEEILRETEASAFAFDDAGVSWRDQRVSTEELAAMRSTFATSFGSCSFEEPMTELGIGN